MRAYYRVYLDLLWIFLKVGVLGFGGGPAYIPLIQREVVTNYRWMTDGEFSSVLAFANTLPGPISIKMAGFVGWKEGGCPGLVMALLFLISPSSLAMLLLFSTFSAYKDIPWVQGMGRGVIPVVAVMLGILVKGFLKNSTVDMGLLRTTGIFVLVIPVFLFSLVHPAIVIVLFILAALLLPVQSRRGKEPST